MAKISKMGRYNGSYIGFFLLKKKIVDQICRVVKLKTVTEISRKWVKFARKIYVCLYDGIAHWIEHLPLELAIFLQLKEAQKGDPIK